MASGAYTTVEYRFEDEDTPILSMNVALSGNAVTPFPRIGENFAIQVEGAEKTVHHGRVTDRRYIFHAPRKAEAAEAPKAGASDFNLTVEIVLAR
jgi:hypothetical protein